MRLQRTENGWSRKSSHKSMEDTQIAKHNSADQGANLNDKITTDYSIDRKPQQANQCPLLGLSGELRNFIYRYALVEPAGTSVVVPAEGMQEPGLLRTCRTIRAEAATIYYCENVFLLNSRLKHAQISLSFSQQAGSWRTTYHFTFNEGLLTPALAAKCARYGQWLEEIARKTVFVPQYLDPVCAIPVEPRRIMWSTLRFLKAVRKGEDGCHRWQDVLEGHNAQLEVWLSNGPYTPQEMRSALLGVGGAWDMARKIDRCSSERLRELSKALAAEYAQKRKRCEGERVL